MTKELLSGYTTERKSQPSQYKPQLHSQTRDNVKFEQKEHPTTTKRTTQRPEKTKKSLYTAQNPELYDKLANDRNFYNSCIESEIDSVYSSSCYHDGLESETESLEGSEDYTHTTLKRMETKVNTMTNRFVSKVKSELDQTFSKLKLQQKVSNQGKSRISKNQGSGDSHKTRYTIENDEMIKQIHAVKANCFAKIEKSLKILQQVDQLTAQLYQNHIVQ